jgi:catechol 2,3-dioxygenase-like lactoylglutathione lyase family enzyme
MRLQLALNVRDIDEAVAYYAKLFDAEPHKRRPGYANFALDKPPLKLVLFENPEAPERLNHLGVEVFEPEDVTRAARRLEDAGLLNEIQQDETCCHATQDKVWSHEPQGLRWEWYRITDDRPGAPLESAERLCCSAAPSEGDARAG